MITVEELVARVTADTAEFKAGMAEVEASSSKVAKGAGIAGLALAAGLAYGADKAIHAAMDMEVENARLGAAFHAVGLNVADYEGQIESAEGVGRKLGFTNKETRDSLATLTIATHSAKDSLADLSVAEDLARVKHENLDTASSTLAKAMTGSARAVKALGLNIIPVTSAYDALGSKTSYASLAQYEAAKATAQLSDKQSTAKEIISLVTKATQGQANAFAGTAAGAMARFHASTEALQEGLGQALLPALSAVTSALARGADFLSRHKTLTEVLVIGVAVLAGSLLALSVATWAVNVAMAANPIGIVVVAIAAFIAVLVVAYEKVKIFHDIVNAAFTAVRDVVGGAFESIKIIVQTAMAVVEDTIKIVLDLIHGDWGAAWNDMKALVKAVLDGIGAYVRNSLFGLGGDALKLARAIGHAIWSGIKAELEALAALDLWLEHKIGQAVTGVVSWVGGEVRGIGKGIVDGILHGIENLPGDLLHALTGGIGSAISGVKSFLGIASPSKLVYDQIGTPMGQGVIMGWIDGTAQLPATMSAGMQTAMQAAITSVQNSRSAFGTAWDSLAQDANSAFDGITGAIKTKTERLIDAQQAARATQALQDTLSNAQKSLAAAQKSGDATAILAAQKALADAQYNITLAAEQKQAAAERLQLNARNALEKEHFDTALEALKKHLTQTGASEKSAQEQIIALFKSYGVKYTSAAKDLGSAFAVGLKEKVSAVAGRAKSLGDSIAQGVAQGILANQDVINNAMLAATAKALAAAKTSIGAKSPSRVFAEQVGGPISQGIAVGIGEKSSGIVGALNQALVGLAGAVSVPDVSVPINAAISGAASAASRSAALAQSTGAAGAVDARPTELHVHFDGSTVVASDRAQMRQFAVALGEFLPA